MTKDKLILSAYGSHNGTVSMFYKGTYYVVEAERWLNNKNIGIAGYMPAHNMQLVFDEITEWLLSKTDRSDVDIYMTGYMGKDIKPKFTWKQMVACDHHTAHAACTFYQSPYKDALVFTFDGGGDNGYFNVYTASRQDGIKLLDKFNQDLGFAYMILADYLEDIKKDPLTIANLVYAGKLMGLCSYGKVHDEWMPAFMSFYDKFNYIGNSYIGGAEARGVALKELMSAIGVDNFDTETTRLSGQLAWDIAATTQRAFEEQFFKYARKYLDMFPDTPICLAGGCALNVLLNTRLAKERNGKVFIPPNTNDCGISVGMILNYQAPETQVDLTYSGLPMMDITDLGMYLQDRAYSIVENISLADLALYISQGFIVGFIQGNSEHGSRALGNRSIFCNPGILDMKDVLNEKVKHREWYRPFAPLVKMENTSKYFDFHGENSRHMTFVADVLPDWKAKLPAITHEDGTGRLQTVTRWQNEAVYDLLTEFERCAGHGVLLNTSFNDNGKPILSRFSDALNLLRNTKLDAVYYHERRMIIFKQGDEKRFHKALSGEASAVISLETSVNVMAFAKDQPEMETKFLPTLIKLSKKAERLTIISSAEWSRFLVNKFAHLPHVKIYTLDNTKHYYNQLLQPKFKKKDHEPELQATLDKMLDGVDIHSTYFFSRFVKPLWMKEVLRDNLFDTKYHLFIDLDYLDDYNYNVVRDLKTLVAFSKVDDVIGMTALKHRDSIFSDEFLMQRFKVKTEHYPLPFIYYGNLEELDWFSTNYEGMLRWWFEKDKIGDPADYCLTSYAENLHRYKFLDLEKNEPTEA
jgi:carbamoyltransferase